MCTEIPALTKELSRELSIHYCFSIQKATDSKEEMDGPYNFQGVKQLKEKSKTEHKRRKWEMGGNVE